MRLGEGSNPLRRSRSYSYFTTQEKVGMVVIVLVVLGVIGMLTMAVRSTAAFLQQCTEKGGYVVHVYRSDGLCVSQDGRIIPIAKE